MTATEFTPLVVDNEGTLYVDAEYSGIHTLVMLADAMPLTFFGDESRAYLRVQQAIDWHVKELVATRGLSGSQAVVNALKEALDKHEAGKVVMQ